MTIGVTHAQKSDIQHITGLLEELDRYYGTTEFDPKDIRIVQIESALFVDPPAAYALLAWDGGELVGLATYSFLWPAAGLTRSLYLKELYVVEACRQAGVGTLLMDAIHERAREASCSRVEWTTDSDNAGAQKFYEKLGFSQVSSKIFYRQQTE